MLSKQRSELFGVNRIKTFFFFFSFFPFFPFFSLQQTVRGKTIALRPPSSTEHVQMIISVQSIK